MAPARETFRWIQAYAVNVAVLDEQHRQLFDIVNQLDAALSLGEGSAAVDPVLEQLVEHATIHFSAEESIMEKYGFPGLWKHRAQHADFRQKLNEFIDKHRAGKAGVPVSLLLFLREWLKEHLTKTDAQYSAFLKTRGVS